MKSKAILIVKPTKVNASYKKLLLDIDKSINNARERVALLLSKELVQANWEIGRHIVQYEQQGNERAEYGSDLLARLSEDLKSKHGSGFGRRNILDMRRFYLAFTSWRKVSTKLSWSHYVALIGITENLSRSFYMKQAINEKLSVRELERQIDSSLFERLALSKDKKGVKKLSQKGLIVNDPIDAIKDPYVLDFLKIPQYNRVSEKQLEQKLIDNLQFFLLELGKGFTFVGRQHRISLRNKHYTIDLVFYHRILRCFVLIDLKIKKVTHADIGQMNMYLNYFKAEENIVGDKEPIGIILSKDNDEIMVEYALGGLSNKIFVSKYQLHLPDKKLLQKQLLLINKK